MYVFMYICMCIYIYPCKRKQCMYVCVYVCMQQLCTRKRRTDCVVHCVVHDTTQPSSYIYTTQLSNRRPKHCTALKSTDTTQPLNRLPYTLHINRHYTSLK